MHHADTETLFFMVRAHGQDHSGAVLELLSDLDAVLDSGALLDVQEYAVAFLYDADAQGIAATLETFQARYAAHFGELTGLAPRNWVVPRYVPVGCFIFHAKGQTTGTLEDELGPMVADAWPEKMSAAKQFIDTNRADADLVASKDAARWKAVITAAGQFNHPGDPMSVVIGRKTLPADVFAKSDLSRELVQFLTSVPWRRSAP